MKDYVLQKGYLVKAEGFSYQGMKFASYEVYTWKSEKGTLGFLKNQLQEKVRKKIRGCEKEFGFSFKGRFKIIRVDLLIRVRGEVEWK